MFVFHSIGFWGQLFDKDSSLYFIHLWVWGAPFDLRQMHARKTKEQIPCMQTMLYLNMYLQGCFFRPCWLETNPKNEGSLRNLKWKSTLFGSMGQKKAPGNAMNMEDGR